ncbi:MAG: RES family NAD+ phosphorylase [Syntrophaceae bacterium]
MVSRRKGPLRAWRIADKRHPLFDGTGARIHGGRWNSPGHAVIYATSSFSCAMLECLANAGTGRIPKDHCWIAINIPKIDIEVIDRSDVPGWDHPDRIASQAYGDRWVVEKRTAVLMVPSTAADGEDYNILINPAHPDIATITCTSPKPVRWDHRLFRPGPSRKS